MMMIDPKSGFLFMMYRARLNHKHHCRYSRGRKVQLEQVSSAALIVGEGDVEGVMSCVTLATTGILFLR